MNITHLVRQMPEYVTMQQRQTPASPTTPQAPPGAGGDAGQVVSTIPFPVATAARKTEPGMEPEAQEDLRHNDDTNAAEFVDRYQEDLRYCWRSESWYVWNGARWDQDGGLALLARARAFSQTLAEEAEGIPDRTSRRAAKMRALSLGNNARIQSTLQLARVDERIKVGDPDQWDADPLLLGVPNGLVDLRDGGFRPPDREAMVTKSCAADYVAGATCPGWETFLQRVLPDDEVRRFMQASAGYWLTGDTGAQVFWFLYGSGANGKSTFLETVYRLAGDYSHRATSGLLASTPGGRDSTNELSSLPGVRLLVGSEVGEGMRLNTELVKDLTGQDAIAARQLYKAHFNFHPSCKLVMFGNHRPTISDTDGGIWRRPRLIPFTQVIPASERNSRLGEELWAAERSGILNWCLEGARLWREEGGLNAPASVLNATDSYREDSDLLGEFLQECTTMQARGRVPLKELYERYSAWCARCGHRAVLSAQKLRTRLEERGMNVPRTNVGRVVVGLSLPPSDDPFDSL